MGDIKNRDEADAARQEARLRRLARREGLILEKSRTRNERVWGWQLFRIVDPATNFVVAGSQGNGYSMNLDEVEKYLNEEAN